MVPACHRVRQVVLQVAGKLVMFVHGCFSIVWLGRWGTAKKGESVTALLLTRLPSKGATEKVKLHAGNKARVKLVSEVILYSQYTCSGGQQNGSPMQQSETAANVLTAEQLPWTCKLIGCGSSCEFVTILGIEEDVVLQSHELLHPSNVYV